MNFQGIQRYIYRRTGHPDSPVTEVSTRIKQFINERYRELMGQEGMNRLRQFTFTFASNTSDTLYALPQPVSRVLGIHERSNDQHLTYMSLDEYRMVDPDPASYDGTPDAYVDMGFASVARQPAGSSEIFVVSSSASDTAITPYYEFVQANLYPRTVTGTLLNGTTGVSADTAIKDVTQITNFFLSATPVGDITLREDAGDTTGTDLAVIKAGDTKARYKKIALVPRPSAAVTYIVDGEVAVADLVQNTDEPLIPEDFHWVLAEMALHDEYIKKEKHQEAERAIEKGLIGAKALKNAVTNPPDFLPVQGALRARGISRLGPFYPADRFLG